MTFVTSEPYVGHMGLGGVGDSKGLMESELRQRHIKWIVNAKIDAVTPVATGAPETGYMIESMVSAICENIAAELAGEPAVAQATWNAICLADFGDTGAAFVALPEIPPRNVTWSKSGKWVHLAKIAFEKYFLRKVRTGSVTRVYGKYVLKLLGIAPPKARRS